MAQCDADHMNIIIVSEADIADRTDFITGKSKKDPFPRISRAVQTLLCAGAEVIAIPCNTAEYFLDALKKEIDVPFLLPSRALAKAVARRGVKKLGIMATEGTLLADIYGKSLRKYGIEPCTPSEASRKILHEVIYSYLKCGAFPPAEMLCSVANELMQNGCDAIALGCTELSLIRNESEYQNYNFIDSLLSLALECVIYCGYEPSEKAKLYIK